MGYLCGCLQQLRTQFHSMMVGEFRGRLGTVALRVTFAAVRAQLVWNWSWERQMNWSRLRVADRRIRREPNILRPWEAFWRPGVRACPIQRYGMLRAAVAQQYLGSMTFFAACEAQAASGSAWRSSSPQLIISGARFSASTVVASARLNKNK